MTTEEFIQTYRTADVSQLALQARRYPDVDIAFALQQIEGWQRAKSKIPAIASIPNWLYPKRLSLEQCSSEHTAQYKKYLVSRLLQSPVYQSIPEAELVHQRECNGSSTLVSTIHHSTILHDLTGGMGIDCYYLSELFDEVHYVEMQSELCALAEHNFALAEHHSVTTRPHIQVHNTTAESYLSNLPSHPNSYLSNHVHTTSLPSWEGQGEGLSFFFLDPARRDSHGGKVFRLEDCTPDITKLYPTLKQHADVLMLKLSPMLDIHEALRHLPDATEVHVIAVQNEVKELLIVCQRQSHTQNPALPPIPSQTQVPTQAHPTIIAANLLPSGQELFTSQPTNQVQTTPSPGTCAELTRSTGEGLLLYEPNAAILKAGLQDQLAQTYGLHKADANTHLYFADTIYEDFPGRIFRIQSIIDKRTSLPVQANVLTRNYPLAPADIKKKYRLRDGGDDYVIGFRQSGKPTLVLATRLK